MQNEHLVEEEAWLSLTAVDHHASLEDRGAVVLAGTCWEASRFHLTHKFSVWIEFQQLVRALSHLALRVEHEAAAEDVDFVAKGTRSVALTAKNRLWAGVRDSLPYNWTSVDFGGDDLFASIEIQASNHVHGVANSC